MKLLIASILFPLFSVVMAFPEVLIVSPDASGLDALVVTAPINPHNGSVMVLLPYNQTNNGQLLIPRYFPPPPSTSLTSTSTTFFFSPQPSFFNFSSFSTAPTPSGISSSSSPSPTPPFINTNGYTVFASKINSSLCLSIPKSIDLFSPPNSSVLTSQSRIQLELCNSSSLHQRFNYSVENPSSLFASANLCIQLVAENTSLVLHNLCSDFASASMYVVEANSTLCSAEVCTTVHAFRE